jgi:hypothetical protein
VDSVGLDLLPVFRCTDLVGKRKNEIAMSIRNVSKDPKSGGDVRNKKKDDAGKRKDDCASTTQAFPDVSRVVDTPESQSHGRLPARADHASSKYRR